MEAIDLIASKIVMLKGREPPPVGDLCLVEHPTRGMMKVTAKASNTHLMTCAGCCFEGEVVSDAWGVVYE